MKLRRSAVFLAAAAIAASTIGTLVTAVPSGAASSGAPVVIALMDPETGVYAVPWRHNDIELAVNQINAKGGIDGHKFEWTGYDTNIIPQPAVTSTQQALSSSPKPTAFIGYSVDDQIEATAQALKASDIPVLEFAQGPAAAAPTVGVPNIWTTVPDLVMAIEASTKYVVSTYHPKTVGIFHTEDIASNADAATAQSLLSGLGVKHFIDEDASDTATDTTDQALAMKGASVVMEFGFPTVEAVLNTALYQNGIHLPIAGDQSGTTLAGFDLNNAAELSDYTFTPYCYAASLSSPQAKAYEAAYVAAYPSSNPDQQDPYIYDSVELLAAAIKADGGNLSPSAINKEMDKITYKGVCGTYHADSGHDMMHTVSIDSFKSGISVAKFVGSFTEPALTKKQLKISA